MRRRYLVEGEVQGVGYRYFAVGRARRIGVCGWVRNLPDGRVELVAEGTRSELEAFGRAVRDSELGHFIREEHVEWSEAGSGFRGFEIVR